LTHIGIPESESGRIEQLIHSGGILIAVHSNDPARLDRALRVFKSAGAPEIFDADELAA
jgi:hypothetical protein